METWVFGVILALVGVLFIACSFGQSELGYVLTIAGVTSVILGSLIFAASFKKWIEHYF